MKQFKPVCTLYAGPIVHDDEVIPSSLDLMPRPACGSFGDKMKVRVVDDIRRDERE